MVNEIAEYAAAFYWLDTVPYCTTNNGVIIIMYVKDTAI